MAETKTEVQTSGSTAFKAGLFGVLGVTAGGMLVAVVIAVGMVLLFCLCCAAQIGIFSALPTPTPTIYQPLK